MIRKIYFIVLLIISNLITNASKDKIPQFTPNILFILVDDLGWKDVGYNGSCFYETPNIDKLARNGVVFTNAYAPAANCAPSRASIMSGQYTPRHGIYTVGTSERGKSQNRKLIPIKNKTQLADSIITLAETLQKAGYKTANIGKWHLGEDPCYQGFDINIAGTSAGNPQTYFSPYKNKNIKDGADGEYLTDRLTNEAIQFMEKHTNNSEQPFFLYLPYYAVHTPLQAKNDLVEKYQRKNSCGGQDQATYAAMVHCMDENIGRLLNSIKQLNITEKTLIIFFSDNGGIPKFSSQYPLRAGKGSYYEGGIREPLIMSWENNFPSGKVIDTPVSGIDIYPSLEELANIDSKFSQKLDGESLIPLITQNTKLKRKELFWHFPIYLEAYDPKKDQAQDVLFRTRPGAAIRRENWKLIKYFENNTLELYNLSNDLSEQNNLVNKNTRKAKQLHGRLTKWLQKVDAPIPIDLNPNYITGGNTEELDCIKQEE